MAPLLVYLKIFQVDSKRMEESTTTMFSENIINLTSFTIIKIQAFQEIPHFYLEGYPN